MGMDTQAICMELVMSGICHGGFLRPAGVAVHCAMHDSMAFLVHRMSGS